MAKAEYRLKGDFDEILRQVDQKVLESVSATLEAESEFRLAGCRCVVRVYERYSWTGSNRVSLNLTLLECGEEICCSAITSGGSQAVFFKLNTFGEEAFLERVQEVLEQFSISPQR